MEHPSEPSSPEEHASELETNPHVSNKLLLLFAVIIIGVVIASIVKYSSKNNLPLNEKTFALFLSQMTTKIKPTPRPAYGTPTPYYLGTQPPKDTILPTPSSQLSPAPTNPSLNPTGTPAPSIQTSQNQSAQLTAINPSSASWQQIITLTGAGFGSSQGHVAWFYNGQEQPYSPVSSWSDTQITVPVAGAGSNMDYQVQVVKADNTVSNKVNFHVIQGQPIIDNAPSSGSAGSNITITGSRFGTDFGGVIFATQPDLSDKRYGHVAAWSDTQITVTIPQDLPSGKYNLVVAASTGSQSSVVIFNVN